MTPRACMEIAECADRSGLAAVWFAENPFERGVLPAVAGAALATERVRIGIGVFNPYNRHPTLIAMELAALDELAGGRAALGIGSGIGPRIVQMGLSYDRPLAAVRDAIEIVRGMLAGEAVSYEGKVFSSQGARLGFVAPRPDMHILMAAMGDQALRVCGQVADGLMVSNMCPPDYTRRALGLLSEGAAKAQRATPTTVVQYVLCALDADRDAARGAVKATIAKMLAGYWGLGANLPAVRGAMVQGSGLAEAEMQTVVERLAAGGDPGQVVDDRLVDAYAVSGDAEDLKRGVGRFAAVGVTELILTFVGTQPLGEIAAAAQWLELNR